MIEPWHGTLGGYTNHRCRCDKFDITLGDESALEVVDARVARTLWNALWAIRFSEPAGIHGAPEPTDSALEATSSGRYKSAVARTALEAVAALNDASPETGPTRPPAQEVSQE